MKAAAETAMREELQDHIQPILTEGRSVIENDTQEIIQKILDEYTSEFRLLKCKLKS